MINTELFKEKLQEQIKVKEKELKPHAQAMRNIIDSKGSLKRTIAEIERIEAERQRLLEAYDLVVLCTEDLNFKTASNIMMKYV